MCNEDLDEPDSDRYTLAAYSSVIGKRFPKRGGYGMGGLRRVAMIATVLALVACSGGTPPVQSSAPGTLKPMDFSSEQVAFPKQAADEDNRLNPNCPITRQSTD